jgi:hypothetical protein
LRGSQNKPPALPGYLTTVCKDGVCRFISVYEIPTKVATLGSQPYQNHAVRGIGIAKILKVLKSAKYRIKPNLCVSSGKWRDCGICLGKMGYTDSVKVEKEDKTDREYAMTG